MNELPLPYSAEAEEAALGCLLTNPGDYYAVIDFLKSEAFFILRNRMTMQAIERLFERDKTVDFISLRKELEDVGQLNEVGVKFLIDLPGKAPMTTNIRLYTAIIWRAYMRRQLLDAAQKISKVAISEELDLNDVVMQTENLLFSVTQRAIERTEVSIKQSIDQVYDQIERRIQGEETNYLPTGFKSLDTVIGGLERGCLHIIGGRPGMGKSSLCAGLAMNAARLGVRSYYISTEMEVNRLTMRMMAMESGVNVSRLKQGDIDEVEWERCIEAMKRLSQIPLIMDYVPSANPSQIKARLARQQRENGIDLLIIDGLWQMTAPGKFDDNRVLQLGYISRLLVDMAKEFRVPVVLAHQLSRKPEDRSDHHPIMSDLEYSGAIEQNADVIMLLYRDEVYNETTETPNQCDVIIGKNRDGTTGTVQLYFDKHTTRFMEGVFQKVDLSNKPMPVIKHNGREDKWQ